EGFERMALAVARPVCFRAAGRGHGRLKRGVLAEGRNLHRQALASRQGRGVGRRGLRQRGDGGTEDGPGEGDEGEGSHGGSGRFGRMKVKSLRRFAAAARRRCGGAAISRGPLRPKNGLLPLRPRAPILGLSRPDGAECGPPGLKPSVVRGQTAGRLNLAECQKDDPCVPMISRRCTVPPSASTVWFVSWKAQRAPARKTAGLPTTSKRPARTPIASKSPSPVSRLTS